MCVGMCVHAEAALGGGSLPDTPQELLDLHRMPRPSRLGLRVVRAWGRVPREPGAAPAWVGGTDTLVPPSSCITPRRASASAPCGRAAPRNTSRRASRRCTSTCGDTTSPPPLLASPCSSEGWEGHGGVTPPHFYPSQDRFCTLPAACVPPPCAYRTPPTPERDVRLEGPWGRGNQPPP